MRVGARARVRAGARVRARARVRVRVRVGVGEVGRALVELDVARVEPRLERLEVLLQG